MNDEPRWADRITELRAERREKVLELRGEGMTQKQIADALGVAVGTVNADLTGEEPEPTTASQESATSALADAYIRGQVRPERPTDGDEFIRARVARKPRAQAVVDRLLGEYATDQGEGDE